MAAEHKYRMELSWSPVDNAWVVLVPDLPGCFADGSTAEEAVANAQEVIDLWLDVAREEGRAVPSPAYYQPTQPAGAITSIG